MSKRADDLDELRSDIVKLQAVIDAMIDEGRAGNDAILSACRHVLRDSEARLQQLEREP